MDDLSAVVHELRDINLGLVGMERTLRALAEEFQGLRREAEALREVLRVATGLEQADA